MGANYCIFTRGAPTVWSATRRCCMPVRIYHPGVYSDTCCLIVGPGPMKEEFITEGPQVKIDYAEWSR